MLEIWKDVCQGINRRKNAECLLVSLRYKSAIICTTILQPLLYFSFQKYSYINLVYQWKKNTHTYISSDLILSSVTDLGRNTSI